MRQIKFRGLNANGQFVYGLPSADAPNSTQYYKEYSCRICWLPEGGGYTNQPIKNGTLGQFTGLKDVNGVEIYEGDIVEYFSDFTEEKSNHQVKYFCENDYPAFDFSPSISDDMNGFSAIVYQEIGTVKVIGNIYQNPELLPHD